MNIANKIVKDKQDLIVLGTDGFTNFMIVIGGIISLVICLGTSIIFLWPGIFSSSIDIFLVSFLFAAISILVGVFTWRRSLAYLVNISVVIDKKSQSVVIKKHSIIKSLNFIKEIPFSHIQEFRIVELCDWGGEESAPENFWNIEMMTAEKEIGDIKGDHGPNAQQINCQGESIKIYEVWSKSNLEKVSEKISKITDKKILPPKHITGTFFSLESS